MAMLSQSKVLAGGSRAFCGVRAAKPARVANGAHATMKRKDSYMVEVGGGVAGGRGGSSGTCVRGCTCQASVCGCMLCAAHRPGWGMGGPGVLRAPVTAACASSRASAAPMEPLCGGGGAG